MKIWKTTDPEIIIDKIDVLNDYRMVGIMKLFKEIIIRERTGPIRHFYINNYRETKEYCCM